MFTFYTFVVVGSKTKTKNIKKFLSHQKLKDKNLVPFNDRYKQFKIFERKNVFAFNLGESLRKCIMINEWSLEQSFVYMACMTLLLIEAYAATLRVKRKLFELNIIVEQHLFVKSYEFCIPKRPRWGKQTWLSQHIKFYDEAPLKALDHFFIRFSSRLQWAEGSLNIGAVSDVMRKCEHKWNGRFCMLQQLEIGAFEKSFCPRLINVLEIVIEVLSSVSTSSRNWCETV